MTGNLLVKAQVMFLALALAFTACGKTDTANNGGGDDTGPALCNVTVPQPCSATSPVTSGPIQIGFLHHSTGGVIWGGGVKGLLDAYNAAHGTQYQISERAYPATSGGYPWDNYPYDYWNLWVNHTGSSQDRGELNLDQLAALYDVLVFKHCYPVSNIGSGVGSTASVSSSTKTLANYQLQYGALKTRLTALSSKKFIAWTGAALLKGAASDENLARSQQFFDWVKNSWDTAGDNTFIWDFYALETNGTAPYLNPQYASSTSDSHPNGNFAKAVAPCLVQRIVDVVEGCGDSRDIKGTR